MGKSTMQLSNCFNRTKLEKTSDRQAKDILSSKLKDTQISAFMSELFTNSGHFLIVKILSDLILDGWWHLISDKTEYVLIAAMLVQTWYLSRPRANRFWGNLIGIAIYTLIDIPVDGWEFFEDKIHFVFASFSLTIATLQGIRFYVAKGLQNWIIPLESLARSMMVVAFYIAIEAKYDNVTTDFQLIQNFFQEKTHWFLAAAMMFLGLLLGLQSLQISKQKQQLQETARLLGNMAEWGMGSHAVATALNNPEALAFHKCDRAIIFMDIRGFTKWCEQRQPDAVAALLNDYYRAVEPLASGHQPLKVTFTADEVMAIYATAEQGVAAAKSMAQAASAVLSSYGIGAGCAVHCGQVIEGLFGSEDVRTYTVIGDVVNTAKRFEGATPAGEITISDDVYQAISPQLKVEPRQPIVAKGKKEKLIAWRLI